MCLCILDFAVSVQVSRFNLEYIQRNVTSSKIVCFMVTLQPMREKQKQRKQKCKKLKKNKQTNKKNPLNMCTIYIPKCGEIVFFKK